MRFDLRYASVWVVISWQKTCFLMLARCVVIRTSHTSLGLSVLFWIVRLQMVPSSSIMEYDSAFSWSLRPSSWFSGIHLYWWRVHHSGGSMDCIPIGITTLSCRFFSCNLLWLLVLDLWLLLLPVCVDSIVELELAFFRIKSKYKKNSHLVMEKSFLVIF